MSDLVVRLTSPEGTTSTLLNRAGLGGMDVALNADDTGWTLTSNAFRGEMSQGRWVLEIQDVLNTSGTAVGSDDGTVRLAILRTYGSSGTSDDTYIYTDEFADTLSDAAFFHGDFSRAHLSDTDGGVDIINAAAVSSKVTLDLNPNAVSWIGSGFFQIEPGTEIEWAFGGDGNDDIYGNALSNQLRGNRGADFLAGKGDVDILLGGDGDDVLAGGAAGDTLQGGDGFDFASYYDAPIGVTASLADRALATGDAYYDLFDSIEGLIGSAHADTLYGDGNANELRGGGSDDHLDGGAGADTMRGGSGDDDYFVDDAGDVVEELPGEGSDDTVFASTTSYTLRDNVENLFYTGDLLPFHGTGNELDNLIVSKRGDDVLDGGAGADKLFGYHFFEGRAGSGQDTLIGGADDDWMAGGDDADTFVFADGWDHDTIADFAVGEDVLDMRQVSGLTSRSLLEITNDENGDAKVTYNENSITLIGVTADQLTDASFLLNTAPQVAVAGRSLDRGGSVQVSDWFSATDPDGDAITQYAFWDGGTDAASGYFRTRGNPHHAANTEITVDAADLDSVQFQGGQTGATETLWVRAYAGDVWSEWKSFSVTMPNTAPLVAVADRSLHRNELDQVSDWFSVSDADGDAITQYRFWDGGTDAASGYFSTPDNPHHAAGTNITVNAADLGNVRFQGGQAGGTETLWVQAFDGGTWSEWRAFTMTTDTRIVGTEGDDELVGDATADIIQGLGGNDKLRGEGGDDRLVGGEGRNDLSGGDDNDTLIGGSWFDTMDGGAGNDTMTGTGGQTVMFGGDGDDTMTGSLASNNSMYGGLGNDVMTGGEWTDWMSDVEGGDDVMHGGGGYDVMVDYYGANELYGEGGTDWLISGSDQGSLLDGGDDDDTLFASFGGNTLIGGAGNDTLETQEGGAIRNIFTGGADADTFVFRAGVSVEANVLVTDFQDGVDHIGLRSFMSFNQLTITDSAEGAVIEYYDTSPMVLAGISASQITQDDFLLL